MLKRILIAALVLTAATPALANGMSQWNNQRDLAWCQSPDDSYPNDNFASGRGLKWGPCWAWR